jgi:translation initiation factor 3 subunit H
MAEIRNGPLSVVQVEALVVMRIVKHCNSAFPMTATGSIVGMDKRSTLEVTSAFAFPAAEPAATDFHGHENPSTLAVSAPRNKANVAYQNEMIKMMKEVNVDANNVGWYTSANLGNFVSASFIENQFNYQKQANERAVALVHDVSRSAQGALSLRAFRLSPSFMAAYAAGITNFTAEKYMPATLACQL